MDAIVALPDAFVMQHRARLIEFATQQRIPAISGWPAFARSGGVMTYGPNLRQSFRMVARSVDKVLKGAHPAEVPVEQPTTFELVINLKAAKALGLTMPASLPRPRRRGDRMRRRESRGLAARQIAPLHDMID